MSPAELLGAVEHPDVVEDVGANVVACGVDLLTHALALEQLEEAIGYDAVVLKQVAARNIYCGAALAPPVALRCSAANWTGGLLSVQWTL